MTDRGRKAPKALKELAVAQFMANYFAKHSEFPSNDEIIDAMKEEFSEEAVGSLYPKDITNLKRGAYKLLQLEVAQPREGAIESELRDFLGLEGAMVVGSPYRNYDDAILRNIIGFQAARFFDENVKDGQTLTLSCSMTMREMIKRIRNHYTGLRVFADSVVAVSQFHIMSPASLVVLFLDRFPECRGTAYTSTPALVQMLGREVCQKILDKEIFEPAFHADWVFVGIGALTRRISTQGLTPGFDFLTHVVTHDAESLYRRGVVGEISYWPFDERGKPVFGGAKEELTYFQHVFTYSKFESLDRNARIQEGSATKVVGAAGGQNKVGAICAAARYLDYLVTDIHTAKAILERSQNNSPEFP